jgi:hypothetical protein
MGMVFSTEGEQRVVLLNFDEGQEALSLTPSSVLLDLTGVAPVSHQ